MDIEEIQQRSEALSNERLFLYRSRPRLLNLGVTSFGSIFFALLSWLIGLSHDGKWTYLSFSLLVFFSILSISAFYLFITIKTVKLSKDTIRISFLVLPFHRTYSLSEIKGISQESKNIMVSNGFSTPFTFKYLTTVFTLSDNRTIKVSSVGRLDYDELLKCFNKVTRGNGQYVRPKGDLLLYLLDNFEGMGIVVLCVILTIGLAWGLTVR